MLKAIKIIIGESLLNFGLNISHLVFWSRLIHKSSLDRILFQLTLNDNLRIVYIEVGKARDIPS